MNASVRAPRPVIFLLSFALISLEIVWTRLLSAEFFYTFAFLILSLAVLGLGLGGLALRLFPRLAGAGALPWHLLATAVLALVGPLAVLRMDLDFATLLVSAKAAGWLLAAVLVLSSAFFTGGMGLAWLFRQQHSDMPRLYRADLLGAALGVLGAIAGMNWLQVPTLVLLLPVPLLLATVLEGNRRQRVLSLVLGLLCLALLPWKDALVSRARTERLPVVERHWDAMGLVKIQRGEGYMNLNIDNAANTPINAFDGNWTELRNQPTPFFLDPAPLMKSMGSDCRFLSVGSGGGGDVLMALKNGAAEVHAVEVNPFINALLVEGGKYSDYSGKLYSDSRVRVISEDARTYIRRHEGRFDIIYSLSSNTFAALASGSFALAENYLFTTEAMADTYKALSARGFAMVEHQFYVPRLVSEALGGLKQCGVEHPERHIAVYALPKYRRQVLLIGKAPLTETQVEDAFLALGAKDAKEMHRLYPRPAAGADKLVSRIVEEGWTLAQQQASTDLSPSMDDRPFTAQQGLLRNLRWENLKRMDGMEYRGFPVAKLLLVSVLVLALLAAPLTLLPNRKGGPRLGTAAWFYFFAIGAGFMMIEVVLLQQFTLVIGPAAYTLAMLLFALLLGSGLGSRVSAKAPDCLPFLAILLWLVADVLFFGNLSCFLGGQGLLLRIAVSIALLLPLGFFMGMAFPKGTARVGDLVDWGFAVNGIASVLGSALALLLAFTLGFRAVLVAAGLSYVAAWLFLSRMAPRSQAGD